MNYDIIVRKAEKEDYEGIVRIMNKVHTSHVLWSPNTYRTVENVFDRVSYEKALQEETVFVAEIDKTVCGLVFIIEKSYDHPIMVSKKVLYIDKIAVEECYRGKGVGTKLLNTVKNMAEASAYDGIELQVNAHNKAAIDMYKNYGFCEKNIHMEIDIKKHP